MQIFENLSWTAILIIFSGCHFDKEPALNSALNRNCLEYSTLVVKIYKELPSPGTWEDLFFDSNFVKLYENGALYVDSAVAFVSNNKYNDLQKSVCIFSMQNVSIELYLVFLDECAALFEKNNMSEDLLLKAISPSFGKKRPIVKNYKNLKERKLLQKIQSGRNISTMSKSIIEDILSGNLYNQLHEFYIGNGFDVNSM